MRIAIFSDTYPPSVNGVSHSVEVQEIMLKEAGHDARVYTPQHSPSISFAGYKGEYAALPLGISVKRAIAHRPDIIHTHTPFTLGWEAVIAAKLLKVPLIGTHHTFFDHYLKHVKFDNKLGKKVSWKAVVGYYNRCDVVIAPSAALIDELVSHGLKRPTRVFPNTISSIFFIPDIKREGSKTVKLVYMGRVSYEKNVDNVLKAFAHALKNDDSLRLEIIGEGPEKGNLEKLAEELGISDKVSFTGLLRGQALVDALKNADIFVTASESENMPLSVIEAMATGLPVLAVSEKGVPEIVKHGVNGLLSEKGDIEALAYNIEKIAKDTELRERYAKGARETAERYSQERVRDELVKLYTEIING